MRTFGEWWRDLRRGYTDAKLASGYQPSGPGLGHRPPWPRPGALCPPCPHPTACAIDEVCLVRENLQPRPTLGAKVSEAQAIRDEAIAKAILADDWLLYCAGHPPFSFDAWWKVAVFDCSVRERFAAANPQLPVPSKDAIKAVLIRVIADENNRREILGNDLVRPGSDKI